MKAHLMKQFPDDTEAIDKFFKIMKVLLLLYHFYAHISVSTVGSFKNKMLINSPVFSTDLS